MKKYLIPLLFSSLVMMILFPACNHASKHTTTMEENEDENEGYDGPREIEQQEIQMTKDPATGRVPIERLWDAISYTKALQQSNNFRSFAVAWQERGPIFDSVGPSNGNGRGGGGGFTGGYSSGRINGFLVDASDLTGNTVFCGGADGGIWKCTNFLSTIAPPNWVSINDYMNNMSIVSFAQDPTNANTMYVATGEPWGNIGAVRGNGVFKSIDHGVTWVQLPSTAGITRSFKIVCDDAGNVYHATGGFGLRRSNDGGNSWTTITPASVAISNCTDIEYTTTGTLQASFGLSGSTIYHRYTTSPATASTNLRWSTSTGIRTSGTASTRLELAAIGDTVYAVACNSSNNTDSCYKSIDGGANFTKMNTTIMPTGVANTQSWYNLTLAINPFNSHEIIVGGLDAYKSSDDGQTFSRISYWVSSAPYVHADHHFMQWLKMSETQANIYIGCDGGMFYSTNNGISFTDRNKSLAIKQFYSCAIHPTQTNYILGGAQDNGSHQFKNPGLTYSTEVTGGDGAFVDIDQDQPEYQFTSFVRNQYRRSTDGGVTWSSFNFSSTVGNFINPFDYDDQQNIMLCSNGSSNFLRWSNPQTATNVATATFGNVTLSELGGSVSTVQVSPYTTGRAFFGSSSGALIRVENTSTTVGSGSSDVTLLTQPTSGNVSCIAIGTNDSNLLAIYSNYGINNVWYSNDAGTNWSAIDGNLPDMPVRWAVFHPTNNNKIVIATEAGVFTTGLINGANTQWFPSQGFPLVRTDMLKLRKIDNTIVAATHGRGMWSGNILDVLPLKNVSLTASLEGENKASLSWKSIDASNKVKYHVQYSMDGINFNEIGQLPYNITSFKHLLSTSIGYYRVMGAEPNGGPIFSNVVSIKSNKPAKGLQLKVSPNPMSSTGNLTISSSFSGNYIWQLCNVQGSALKAGHGSLQAGGSINQVVDVSKLSPGMYLMRVIQGNEKITASFIKQ